MSRPGGLIALGVTFFVLFLIANFPADIGLRWLAPAELSAVHVGGTIWKGRAASAAWAGLPLGELRWRLLPSRFFLGRLGLDISATHPGSQIEGKIALATSGRLFADGLRIDGPLRALAGVLPDDIPTGLFDGAVRAEFESLALVDGWPEKAVGVVTIGGLQLNNPPETLGDFRIQFGGEQAADAGGSDELDGVLRGEFSDVAGPLAVRGSVTFGADRSFGFQCTGNAREGASQWLQTSLGLLCPPG